MAGRQVEAGSTRSAPQGSAPPRGAGRAPSDDPRPDLPHGASAAPLAVGLGCAFLATAFGWTAGWPLIAIAGGYVLGGMTGLLAGGLAVMILARRV